MEREPLCFTNDSGDRQQQSIEHPHGSANWVGKIFPGTDDAFEQFDTPQHGIRAAAKIIINYGRDDHINTLNAIIQRWAPSIENNTVAYVGDVSRRCGVSPFEPFNTLDPDCLADLVEAMIYHENGLNPYARSVIEEGVQMALE